MRGNQLDYIFKSVLFLILAYLYNQYRFLQNKMLQLYLFFIYLVFIPPPLFHIIDLVSELMYSMNTLISFIG